MLFNLARFGFLAAFCLLLIVSAKAFLALTDVQDRIRYRIPENTIWAAAQGEIELGRTLSLLAPIANGALPRDDEPLGRQFDLLWSRAQLYRTGLIASEVRADPELHNVLDGYDRALERADIFLEPASAGDQAAAKAMLAILSPQRSAIRALTMASLNSDRREREQLSADYELLQDRLQRFGSAAAVLLGLLLAYLIVSERRARVHLREANEARHELEEAQARSQRQAERMELLARKATTASSAKSEFLAMMSHDIRTPLNAIIGLSELMAGGALDGAQRRMLDTISKASEGLLTLINDILDLTRLEAGKLPLSPAPFSPAELGREIREVTDVLAGRNGNSVTLDLDPALPEAVLGDGARIRQVLLNLAGNSNKFTSQGRVTLSITRVAMADGEPVIRFAVCDTGKGITRELRKRLFQPFEQGADARQGREGSTGLGLAISERLVRLMGGSIKVESEAGKGSLFFFDLRLPAVAPAVDESITAMPARLDLSGRRVLVADDTEASLMVARLMFEGFGARVDAASDGDQAIARGQAQAYDLIVLDVQMPGTDGVGAMQALKKEGPNRNAVFVALTAQGFPRDRARLLAAGFDVYLSKPVRKADIVAALGGILSPGASAMPVPQTVADPIADDTGETAEFDETMLGEMVGDVGPATLLLLVNQMEAETGTALGKLAEQARAGDREGMRKTAHKLAGLLSQFGLPAAAGIARGMEEPDFDGDATSALESLSHHAGTGLSALRRHLDTLEGEPQPMAAADTFRKVA